MAISMGETVLLLRAAKYLYRMHAMHLYHQQHRERCLKYMLCVCKVYVQKGICHIAYIYIYMYVCRAFSYNNSEPTMAKNTTKERKKVCNIDFGKAKLICIETIYIG